MSREFKLFMILAAAFVAGVLRLDAPGTGTQVLLGIAAAAFVGIMCRRLAIAPVPVVWCVLVAMTGELILSLGWGLYSYRHALIPLYVPAGHALFYALAVVTARQPALQRHQVKIVRAVLALTVAGALISLHSYGDTWGLLWSIAVVALVARSHHPLMLSACITYTVMLEWAGTMNGNWQWAADVPYVGLTSANPPSGVGLLYVLLDVVVVTITASSQRLPQTLLGAHVQRTDAAEGDVGGGADLVVGVLFEADQVAEHA
jgi:hypothetical protein